MNWGSLKSQVLSRIHDDSLASKVPDWFNEAQLELLAAAQWRHLDADKILPTTAPYSTGTATVSAGGTTVTFGGGASIPTGAAGQLISLGGFYYKIATRDSSTQVTLDSAAVAAVSAGAYQILFYQLNMPSDFSPPRLYEATIQTGDGVNQLSYTQEHGLFQEWPDESRTIGQPTLFRFWAGKMQLWPPPDGAYNVKIYYHREPSEMTTSSADSTALDWPDDLQYALLQGVLAIGYEFIDDTLANACRQRFDQALVDAKSRNNRPPGVGAGRLKRWDGPALKGRTNYRLPEPIG